MHVVTHTHIILHVRSCGKKGFDINRQIVYTMRSCGLGYSGVERFTSFIIIIISLFNVDAKNKVKNYNKKEIIVYIINYNI